MLSNISRLVFAVAAVLALSACTHPKVEASRQFASALVEARTISDPWKAHAWLVARHLEIVVDVHCGSFSGCAHLPERIAVQKEIVQYLVKASEADNPAALVALFEPEHNVNSYVTTARERLAPRLLSLADTAQGGTPDELDLIYVAGSLVASGNYVTQQTHRAAAYYAKAWAAGSAHAANAAAIVHQSKNDIANAYLWSLRCIAPCQRNYELDLARLQQKLPPSEADRIQAVVAATLRPSATHPAGDGGNGA